MNSVTSMVLPAPPDAPAQPVVAVSSVGEESLERLEARICSQAAHIAASTCGWLLLMAEFDRRTGWAQWGLKSCAHWLSWACSVSAQAAREYVRVARSLPDLPLIVEAFAAGRLSYSKVKVLTRVAGVVPEQTLLQQGLLHTASQLQRVVREFRKTDSAGVDQQRQRKARWFWDEDGMFVLTARLPADEGAILLAALRAAEQSLGEPPTVPTSGAQPDFDEERADHGDDVDRVAEADAVGVDMADGHEDEAGAVGGSSGDCPRASDALVRRDSEQGGWSTADALMAMAQNALAAGPVDSSGDDRHLLVLHVDAAMLTGPPEPPEPPGATESAEASEPAGSNGLAGSGGQGGVGRCHLEDGPGVALTTVERLICDSAVVAVVRSGLGPLLRGEPLRLGRRTRKISAGLRRALRVRDGGCQFPGCPRRRHLEAHHVVHWKNGGCTDLDNLVLVCRFHHMQVHEGGFTVAFAGPTSRGVTVSGWVFHRPDGVPVPTVRVMVPGPCSATDPGSDSGTDTGSDTDTDGCDAVVDEEAAQSRLGGGFSLAESVGVFCRAADGPSEPADTTTGFTAFDLFPDSPDTETAATPTTAPPTARSVQPAMPLHRRMAQELIDNTDISQFDTFDELMAFYRKILFTPQATW